MLIFIALMGALINGPDFQEETWKAYLVEINGLELAVQAVDPPEYHYTIYAQGQKWYSTTSPRLEIVPGKFVYYHVFTSTRNEEITVFGDCVIEKVRLKPVRR